MPDKTPTPAPGQIWADNDPRCEGRYVRIVTIDDIHAAVRQVAYDPSTGIAVDVPGGRRTRIRLDRLRPTSSGYRYVGDAETTA
ncbi:hypothetical protein [Streptomyces abikoensis]|uniref:Uncharacterized protein n=1 Tax=Streptomyces abikoensis TaxID=97398 RepID=A0ABW7T9J1_9ACTN